MLTFLVILIIVFALVFTVWGWKLIREDNQINDFVEYEWLEENERLDDGIESRHYCDDFLDNWEAEWNREAIRIEFDRLMFLNDINATSALWQLEIEKIGSESSGKRTVPTFINE